MKGRTKCIRNIQKKMEEEKGMVIVEATFVFPIMFFVVFFIIFIGIMYYQQAKIDDIVLSKAIEGAECIADPFHEKVAAGSIPTDVKGMKVEPYRYIIGSITNGSVSDLENRISNEVREKVSGRAQISNVTSDNPKIATFKNYVIYSTFVVQVNYEYTFPIRFIGNDYPTIITLSSRAEVSINDSPEFIRNMDLAVDLLDGTEFSDRVESVFEKVKEFIGKFK